MVIVLFRSRLTSAAGDDYAEMATEMVSTAQGMPGFVGVKSYQARRRRPERPPFGTETSRVPIFGSLRR